MRDYVRGRRTPRRCGGWPPGAARPAKAKFKKVQITSTRSWSSLEVTIEGDILKLDADPSYERSDGSVQDYSDRIRTTLEAAL